MKAGELREKTPDQLRDMLIQLKKEQFNLRFRAATNQIENTARVRAVRRDVARVQTVMTEKVRQAAAGGEAADGESAGAAEPAES